MKEALQRGVTWYDSASKAGSENEALFWVELKPDSKAVMPNFTQLVKINDEKAGDKVVIDCAALANRIKVIKDEIEQVEIYIKKDAIVLENAPDTANINDI